MTEIMTALGNRCDGTAVSCDIKKLPHLLIAGGDKGEAKRYLTALLSEAVREKSPDTLRVLAIGIEEASALPHLICPVITDGSDAKNALAFALCEAERRFELFSKAGARNVDGYNEQTEDKLYYLVCAVGELEGLTKDAENSLVYIVQKARAAGIYLLVCTENAGRLANAVKANIPSRIALKTETKAESRRVLDVYGAEKLDKNELLFLPVGKNEPEKLIYSAPSDDEIKAALSEIANAYPRADFIAFGANENKAPSLLVQALEAALRYHGISTALLQRALHIGYKKAAALIEEMEAAGYIGKYRHSKQRELLFTEKDIEKLREK